MRNFKYLAITLALVLLVAAAGACGAQAKAPSIMIVSPANGATLPAGPVTVTVQVANFTLANKLGQPAMAGEGHIHYYIDVDPPTTPGKPATTAPGTFSPTSGLSYTWNNVMPGMHTFSVQLANNDHTPVIPIVTAKVTVTVK